MLRSMTPVRFFCLASIILSTGMFASCGADSKTSGSSEATGSDGDPDGDPSFSAEVFTQHVRGLLANQGSLHVAGPSFRGGEICDGTVHPDFCDFWLGDIATLDNSDSLMGFLEQNVVLILGILDDAGWNYETEGVLIAHAEVEGEQITAPFYSVPLELEDGVGAALYFGWDRAPDPSFSDIDYRSEASIQGQADAVDGHTVLILKQQGRRSTFLWVEMGSYVDRETGVWEPDGDVVRYQRDAQDEVSIVPNHNRGPEGASGGRTVLFVADPDTGEVYFEHLTSTEKHNRQEHYAIRLTSLEDVEGRLRVGEGSSLGVIRARRAYFPTIIGQQEIDLVNEAATDQVGFYALQGRVTTGLRFHFRENDREEESCLAFAPSLSVDDVDTSAQCAGGPLALPTLTDVFDGPSPDLIYLPGTGDSTLDALDLRVNMHALYGVSYDPEWIGGLPVE